MAVVYKCDKCGKILNNITEVNSFPISRICDCFKFDLCDDCLEKLKHWLNGECKCHAQ